jgi:hypothetical protein
LRYYRDQWFSRPFFISKLPIAAPFLDALISHLEDADRGTICFLILEVTKITRFNSGTSGCDVIEFNGFHVVDEGRTQLLEDYLVEVDKFFERNLLSNG